MDEKELDQAKQEIKEVEAAEESNEEKVEE